MIYFLLDLDARLSQGMRFEDHSLKNGLRIYHSIYEGKYQGHSVHQRIAKNESWKQIYGGKYHNYDARTIDGDKVQVYDYMKPGYNLVVLWATWCAPCRKECRDIAEFIGPYVDAGLNVLALAREFKNTDQLRDAVEKDKYPWHTLVDLDDEFNLFDRHATGSSAVFLINPEGEIVFTGLDLDELKKSLSTYMPEVKI